MQDYIDLYARNEEDKKNPYFAPYLAKDLSNQPDTLILTSEFDPLRDEGEAYGKRLKKRATGYRFIGLKMPFTAISHWESSSCMCRKVSPTSMNFEGEAS